MRSNSSRRRPLAGAALAVAVVAALAGCATNSGENGSGGETSASDEVAQRAAEQLEAIYGAGTMGEPADDGPPAQTGRHVFMVNSGVQNPTGTKMVTGAQEAADLLGWELTVFDGKYDPSLYQEGIRQGIAQGADAIWLYSVDCPLVQTALDEARQAGIPVFSQEAAECSDDPDVESYFAASLPFSEGTFADWGVGLGEAQAIWLLAQLGEKANVIEVSVPELVLTKAMSDGFNAKIDELCPTCEVTTVQARTAEFGPALQEKIATALLRNPDANGLALSYEDVVTAGGSAAVMESGRNDSLYVASCASFAANVELIRNNAGQDAGCVFDLTFETWAAADMINRYFAGVEPGETGVGHAVIDRDHGLPAEGEDWATEIDYESIYKKVWGVS